MPCGAGQTALLANQPIKPDAVSTGYPSDDEIGAMREVKQALDPKGILNPGKMFEVFETWKQPKVAVSFPWDHK